MLKPFLAAALFSAVLAAGAFAQETSAQAPDAAPPPVESLTCAQMQAEMMTAGQRMNAQLDPAFGAEAQAMYDDAQRQQRSAMAQGAGMSAICVIPGMGMACAAAQQQQVQQAQQQTAGNQARTQAQMDRLNASMQGIDQERMQAISQRWESQHCEATEPSSPR